jgi:hypothetical protein
MVGLLEYLLAWYGNVATGWGYATCDGWLYRKEKIKHERRQEGCSRTYERHKKEGWMAEATFAISYHATENTYTDQN